VEGRGRRVDVGVVLGAGLLEAVQVGGGVVLGEAGIGLTLLRQLESNCGISFGRNLRTNLQG
jgi:hypothetical protein